MLESSKDILAGMRLATQLYSMDVEWLRAWKVCLFGFSYGWELESCAVWFRHEPLSLCMVCAIIWCGPKSCSWDKGFSPKSRKCQTLLAGVGSHTTVNSRQLNFTAYSKDCNNLRQVEKIWSINSCSWTSCLL